MAAPDAIRHNTEHVRTPASECGERTAADLSGLLVELGRVLRGRSFYGPNAPSTLALADRAWRAWSADLARAGSLEFSLRDGTVCADALSERVSIAHLGELACALRHASIERLRLSTEFTRESFLAFVAELGDAATGAGMVDSRLGIEVNGECLGAVGEPRGDLPAELLAELLEEPPGEPLEESLDWPEADRAVAAPLALGTDLPKVAANGTTLPAHQTGDTESKVRATLEALEHCTDDDAYVALAAELVELARALAEAGEMQAVGEAIRAFADHASDGAPRSALTVRIARGSLAQVARGRALDELISRACSSEPRASIRAAQVLLELGRDAIPAILDGLEAAGETPRSTQLLALVIALGDAAAPCLVEAIERGNPVRTRTAIRIAGHLQAPTLLAPLRAQLSPERASFAKDAARALVEIGNSAAVEALLDGAHGQDTRIARIAVFSLGTLGAPNTLRPLVELLHQASQRGEWRLVREVLGSISQFQTCDPATAERLKSFVCQPRLGWHRPAFDLRLEAITALGQLSGASVERALQEIATSRAPRQSARLRERARRILERRGRLSRPGAEAGPLQ